MEQSVEAPEWINKSFLSKVLEKSETGGENNVKVTSFTVTPAVAPGNNYLSYIYRVKVEMEGEDPTVKKLVSLIVKVPFDGGFMKELVENHDFYNREPKIYGELLPSLSKKVYCSFGPKSLFCPVKNVLVMEDLKEQGYMVCDKIKQLDYFHCKILIEKLAKFHASTVSYFNENPNSIKDVGQENFWAEGSPVEPMVQPSLENIVKTVSDMEGYENFADYLAKRVDQIWNLAIKMAKPKSGGFNVLNHGDLWTNNILFKYNKSAEVVDVKLIDFQLARFASPVNDLVYFMWTSANDDVRGKRQKTLFHIYLQTLNKTLEKLGCVERLSLEELIQDIKKASDLALMVVAHLLPFMMADVEDAPDLSALGREGFYSESFTKVFKGKAYNSLFPKVVKNFIEFFLKGNDLLK